jgi:transcriptional regulator with XRE-family HTH domain
MTLEQYIKNNGLTDRAFAELANITPRSVWNYRNGHRMPAVPIMQRITQITNGQVTANDFYQHQ